LSDKEKTKQIHSIIPEKSHFLLLLLQGHQFSALPLTGKIRWELRAASLWNGRWKVEGQIERVVE
jgi:hypothetical protein